MNTQTAIMRKLNYDPQSGIFTWKDGAHRRTDQSGKRPGLSGSGTVGNGEDTVSLGSMGGTIGPIVLPGCLSTGNFLQSAELSTTSTVSETITA